MSFAVEFGPVGNRRAKKAKLDDIIPLAEKLITEGKANVMIRQPSGDPLSLDEYRAIRPTVKFG